MVKTFGKLKTRIPYTGYNDILWNKINTADRKLASSVGLLSLILVHNKKTTTNHPIERNPPFCKIVQDICSNNGVAKPREGDTIEFDKF